MKPLFYVMSISFLLSSCGVINNTSFHKRKHLKGHFWKFRDVKRSNDEKKFVAQEGKIEQTVIHAEVASKENNSANVPRVVSSYNDEILLPNSEELTESIQEYPVERDDSINANPTYKSNNDRFDVPRKEEESFWSKVLYVVVLIAYFGYLIGLIGLIVYLVLLIFSNPISWLLYSSLIVMGITGIAVLWIALS